MGLPAAWLTGRLRPGEPAQVEAIALILLLAGFSTWLEVSALLAAMIAGALVANLSAHHTRSFNEIEHIEWPFLVFFFVLSGASVDLRHLGMPSGSPWPISCCVWRGATWTACWGVSGPAARHPVAPRHWPGAAPQAGIAMGMALLAVERFPEHGAVLLAAVVASTVVFEVVGPLMVRRVLR